MSDLAIHVPCLPLAWSPARTHDVWDVWTDADANVRTVSADLVRPSTKYPSALDEYLKTVAPRQDTDETLHVPHTTHPKPSARLRHGYALLRKPPAKKPTQTARGCVAPLAMRTNAQSCRARVHRANQQAPASNKPTPTALSYKALPHVAADAQPRRAQWAARTDHARQRPVVSNPYAVAACTSERAEHHLLHLRTTGKPPLKALVHLVRRLVQHGAVVHDWLDTCEVGSELLDVAPVPFKKSSSAHLLTPTRLRDTFRQHVDVLVYGTPHARELVTQLLVALLPAMRSGWWHTQPSFDHALTAAASKLPPLHNTSAVKAFVSKQPTPVSAVLQQYVHACQLKDASFRKDTELLAWALAWRAHVRDNASDTHQTGGGAAHPTANHATRLNAPAYRVRRLRLSTSDRVPQHVHVSQKKVSTASPSASSFSRTFAMPTCCVRPLTPKATKASQSNTAKSTAPATSTTPSKACKASKPSGGGAPAATKTTSRTLTTTEIDAYRQGLKAHIKAKGGTPFLKAQQEQQNKRIPAFDFTALVPQSHPCHASLQKKLKLSAKNRNALRKIKRKVLRAYGGLRTFRKSNTATAAQSGGASHPYGSLYTKKNVGGSRSDDAANAPYVCGSQMPTRQDASVTWETKDSLGASLRDTSQMDLNTTAGTSDIDLGSLEVVDVA